MKKMKKNKSPDPLLFIFISRDEKVAARDEKVVSRDEKIAARDENLVPADL
jgi:hypothetical protein